MMTDRPAEALRRLAQILHNDRRRSADAVPALYVRPLDSDGRALVDIDGEIVEATSLGGLTYAPGTEVPVGKPRGGRERLILGGPPSGKQGVSAHPVLQGGSARPRPPEPPTGPPPLPPPEAFDPLPPGFGPQLGGWGRYHTYASLAENTAAWAPGRKVKAVTASSEPHPTAEVSPDLPITEEPTGAPFLHRGFPHDITSNTPFWPRQTTFDAQPDQWFSGASNGSPHVLDIPLRPLTGPHYVLYNDAGQHSAWLVFPGTQEDLAFQVFRENDGPQFGFINMKKKLAESRYPVPAEEAWAALQEGP